MFPILFEYHGLKISSYGLMLMLAFVICNYLLRKYLLSINEQPDQADDIIFYAAIGGILGSKLYYIAEKIIFESDFSNIYGFLNIFKGIFSFDMNLFINGINQFGSGLVFLGGLIGGMISVTFYVRKKSLKWLKVADWVAPYLILGQAIGRIGCFLVGDCYGKPCTLPWAVKFPEGLPPTTFESFKYNYPTVFNLPSFQSIYSVGDYISVHPTQLYEAIIYIIIYFYLIFIRSKKKHYSGLIMFEYLFLAGMARFLVEFIRLNPAYIFNLSGAQLISLVMILVSSFMMYKNRKKSIA